MAMMTSAFILFYYYVIYNSKTELSNEDGEKELQDLKTWTKTSEEKEAKAEGVHTYSEEQGGFIAQEFEKFVAEEDGKLQAKVTVDTPLMPIVEKEFAVKDSSRTEEYQHGKSGGKFEDLEICCDGFWEVPICF